MRILYLTHKLDTPSTRWRVLQVVPYLERQGWEVKVLPIPGGMLSQLKLLEWVPGYDVVVLQKRLLPAWWMKLLRRKSRRLIYEFDDTVTVKHRNGAAVPSKTREKRFGSVVKHADAVTTSNEYLASLCAAHAPREKVTIISNAVEPARWKPRETYGDGPAMTIGWSGSAGNLVYLNEVVEVMGTLQKENGRVVFQVVCEEPFSAPGVTVTHKVFSAEAEPDNLVSFDIAIAPMPDNEWTRGKQTMKILTYFCAGLPVVASDVPASRVWITPGENGLLARTPEEWGKHLRSLIADPRLRERLGRTARKTAEEKYSVEKIAVQLIELFKRLCR